ncbi:hypothetical protein HMPREF3190_00606 [Umbribacter vaginalis]|nr:hypothetical protein HMPREF3190_00606 [Coriobacteriales bacterium DNF00809]
MLAYVSVVSVCKRTITVIPDFILSLFHVSQHISIFHGFICIQNTLLKIPPLLVRTCNTYP